MIFLCTCGDALFVLENLSAKSKNRRHNLLCIENALTQTIS